MLSRSRRARYAETLGFLAEVLKSETDVLLRGEASAQHEATAGIDLTCCFSNDSSLSRSAIATPSSC
jgi:hypothetical protein